MFTAASPLAVWSSPSEVSDEALHVSVEALDSSAPLPSKIPTYSFTALLTESPIPESSSAKTLISCFCSSAENFGVLYVPV